MKENLTGKSTIIINTNASKVWEALTKPELVKKYFFGTDVKTDWKVGSSVKFTGEWEGKKYEDKGTILASEPKKLITYSYWSSLSGKEDKPENYNKVSYSLSENEGKTKLTIIQEGIATEEEKIHSEKNWSGVLKSLKELLEKNTVST